MLTVAAMDDAALLGFLNKRHKDVLSAIAATADFELKGEYTAETLVPVVKTIVSLKDTSPQESIKKAAGALSTQFDVMVNEGVEETPQEVLHKALSGITAELEKRGARNSANDIGLIQHAHDTICKLGAACASPSPHSLNGTPVALPPGTASKADGTTKEGENMDPKLAKDAITSEGNKRGADVTSPTMPAESSNATNNADAPDPSAVGAVKAKAKPSWMDEQDGDDDATKANKAKAREMFGKSEPITITKADLAELVRQQVDAAITKAALPRASEVPVIPRVHPSLMQVGKDGTVQKASMSTRIDELKKSVSRHQADEDGRFKKAHPETGTLEDNDTCTVIKAIHANRVMVPEAELQSLGLLMK